MSKKAFTLTEIIAVIVIIGIVILIAIPVSRRYINSNNAMKIENKQRVVEKAMIAYAETDKRKLDCVIMTIGDLINGGYITSADLHETDYKPAVDYYYYKGNITEGLPRDADGVTCGRLVSSSTTEIINTEEEEIVNVPELIEVVNNTYTLTVTRTGTDYGVTDMPTIILKTGSPSNLKVECTTSNTCTLGEVPLGTAVTYSVAQKYYKAVSGYSLSGTMAATNTQEDQTREIRIEPKGIKTISKQRFKTDDFSATTGDITIGTANPYKYHVAGRILEASASGTVSTCNAISGEGYCHEMVNKCTTTTQYIRLGASTYLMNQTFYAGTPSGWNAAWKSSARSYDCHRKYNIPTKTYTFSDNLSDVYISNSAVGGTTAIISLKYLEE